MAGLGVAPGRFTAAQAHVILSPMRIQEPMTTFTDAVLAVECFVLASWLLAEPAGTGEAGRWWALALVALGVGAASGAAAHGLVDYLSPRMQHGVWLASLAAIGAAGAGMLAATVRSVVPPPAQGWLIGAVGVKLVLYLAWLVRRPVFRTAILDYGSAMLGVVILQLWSIGRGDAPAAPWILGAVLVSLAGSAIQQARLGLGPRFNHNDVYHVIQMVAIYLFYRGGALLTDI